MFTKMWIKKLFKELANWVGEGIIKPEQAEMIKGKYSKELQHKRLVSSIYVLGAILIGLGILLFIASNWQFIRSSIKIGMLFSLVIGFNFFGYYLKYINIKYPKLGESMLFLGAISFGAGIWLIAQMLQIPINYTNGVLFWFLGILPVVFVLKSKINLVLSSILMSLWLIMCIFKDSSCAYYSFILWLAVVLWLIYREKQKSSLFFAVTGAIIWINHYLYILIKDLGCFPVLFYANLYIALGFVLYSLGILHSYNKYIAFSGFYRFFGILFILFSNYSLTFRHYHEIGYRIGNFMIDSLFARMLSYSVYAIPLLIIIICIINKPYLSRKVESIIIFSLLIIQFVIMNLNFSNIIIVILYNIVLFVEIITFIYLGYRIGGEYILRTALCFFGLFVITRYFDTLWNILPRSIFFLLGGIILIAGGFYMEKNRRIIEKKLKERRV